VVDTGLDFGHAFFAGRIHAAGYDYVLERPVAWERANGRDDDRDGFVDEAYGHGTHIAGTILLINPEARILPLRVVDSEGNGTAFAVARAIHDAVAAGADIINLSLSMTRPSAAVEAALHAADEAHVAVFSSAGNTGGRVLYPAAGDDVVGVASVDSWDVKSSFSAFGRKVDVSAPGEGVYSALPGQRWGWWSGTSMACAVASGVGSLAVSAVGPGEEIDAGETVEDSGVDIDPLNPALHDLLGDGRVDALEAAQRAQH